MGLVLPFEEMRERHPRLSPRSGATARGPFLDLDAIRARRRRRRSRAYDIRPPDRRLKTANFSGGNQQKIVLAREIERDPEGAAHRPADARRRYRRDRVHPPPASSRCATPARRILLVSVELDEIRALSDRILVMFGGRIVGERAERADESELGLLMAGVDRGGGGGGMRDARITPGDARRRRSRARRCAFYEALGWRQHRRPATRASSSCKARGWCSRSSAASDLAEDAGISLRGPLPALSRHHARDQPRQRDGRSTGSSTPALDAGGRAVEAAGEGLLGRLFRLFRRSRRPSLGARLQPVLPDGRSVAISISSADGTSTAAHEPSLCQTSRAGRLRPDPAPQRRRRLPRLRPRRADHRREPARGGDADAARRLRLRRGHRLHALLRDQLHLHRPCRRGRLPCRAVQHRRRGPGLSRRPRRRARSRSALDDVAALVADAAVAIVWRPPAFGAAWAFIPAILQAKRGSHIVITTIMFNFIAAGADGLSPRRRR